MRNTALVPHCLYVENDFASSNHIDSSRTNIYNIKKNKIMNTNSIHGKDFLRKKIHLC